MTWPLKQYPVSDLPWIISLVQTNVKGNVYLLFCGWKEGDMMKKLLLLKKKTRVQKSIPYLWPKWRQNGQNRYPIYVQNGWKTLPFGAAHTYIAHIREYPPHPGGGNNFFWLLNKNCHLPWIMFMPRFLHLQLLCAIIAAAAGEPKANERGSSLISRSLHYRCSQSLFLTKRKELWLCANGRFRMRSGMRKELWLCANGKI